MKVDRERDLEAKAVGQLMQLGTGADNRSLGRPKTLGGLELDARATIARSEDARVDQPVAERARKPIDDGAHVDRAAEFVEEGCALRRLEDGEHAPLLIATDQPRRHTRRFERSRTLGDIRPADENALSPEQRCPEVIL